MINNVTLTGRLCRDIELNTTQSGFKVGTTTIAVDRPKGKDQEKAETDFIRLVAWRDTAELMAKWLGKGRLVGIEGRIQVRQYEKDGQKREVSEVVVDRFHFLDKGKDEQPDNNTAAQQQKRAAYNAGLLGDDVTF